MRAFHVSRGTLPRAEGKEGREKREGIGISPLCGIDRLCLRVISVRDRSLTTGRLQNGKITFCTLPPQDRVTLFTPPLV